jgi:outer membrane lipoprotein SlyB
MKIRHLGIGVAFALLLGFGGSGGSLSPETAVARTQQNFTTPARSAECSRRARRHADRNTTRRNLTNTAAGAIAGTAIGGVAGRSSGTARTGALIGGGAGAVHSATTNRWQTLYNRRYSACINGYSLR